MVKTRQWLLQNKPDDLPQLEGSDATFRLAETDLPELKDDELLVKAKFISNDPAQRGWISPDVNADRLYTAPVELGGVMNARSLGEVVESKSSSYKKGDWVLSSTGWSEYAIIPAKQAQPAPDLPGGLSKTHYLGALGFTGMTAYYGLVDIARATKDDIVVVSGAAGATGSMVVQIAKKIVGCKKVIGIAGTDDKCRWVESLGADTCLNYKSSSFAEDLAKALPGPDGWANVYFDNVGGDILDLMLTHMALHGRVAACGAVSNYNNAPERLTGVKNWYDVIVMRIQILGFIVFDFVPKMGETGQIFLKALSEGKLKIDDSSEQVVKVGFEDVPKTWMSLFTGSNTGKLITALQ